jgi:chromosome segregation protein
VRLIKLKIAGFKSFVEPTTVLFPSQLAGVVGPNGCGKSNIIDAVRWVLGESKASELRGESIQDVIFKGSGNRKPVSRASVELIFRQRTGRARPASGLSMPRLRSSVCSIAKGIRVTTSIICTCVGAT